MAAFAPDFESLFEQRTYSDVSINIQEGVAEPPRKRTPGSTTEVTVDNFSSALGKRKRLVTDSGEVVIPGHTIVLLGSSDLLKDKLNKYASSSGLMSMFTGLFRQSELQIHMTVPPGQTEVARLLIKGMYQKEPTITADLNHEQLLQLMLLADDLRVPKVLAAVLQAFQAIPADQLQWQTALDILQLPPACAKQPDFEPVQQLAMARLLQDLGDLERAWADEHLQELLLNLPFAALHQLLQHPALRVASENTVVYTIQRWFEQQYGAPAGCMSNEQTAQAKQLMKLVRMQHCTPLFVSTIRHKANLFCSASVRWSCHWLPSAACQTGIPCWQKQILPCFRYTQLGKKTRVRPPRTPRS